MNLMKYRWIYLGIFGVTMILSIIFIFVNPYNGWGTKPGSSLNLGIDFTGGTKIYFPLDRAVSSDEVSNVLKRIELPDFKYNPPQPNNYVDTSGTLRYQVIVYTRFLNDAEQDVVIKTLEAEFGQSGQELDITRVDPLIGKEMLQNALNAILIASLLMLIYIWFRFELVSGVIAIITLLYNALIVVGIFGILGKEVDSTMIAAILTILGYSINDTIVVFDRIRENLRYKNRDVRFVELVNDSILQTFRRSLNTGLTTILTICILFIMVPNIREFCFALLVGFSVGTYSSLFMASPIWAIFKDWQERKKYASKPANATH